MGKTYRFYNKKNGSIYLSILGPEECNFDFIFGFRLNSELVWERSVRQFTPPAERKKGAEWWVNQQNTLQLITFS